MPGTDLVAIGRLFTFVGCMVMAGDLAAAGEWPQVLGPQRNGVATGEKFTGTTSKLRWKFSCGSGLAGVAVAKNRVVLFHRLRNQETITCLDAHSGAELWSHGYPSNFQPQIINDNGPRAVPAIVDGKVITFGAQGVLTCVLLESGQRLWQRETHQDFNAPEGYFGAGSAPLVVGSRVIVNVGGRQQSGVVAFDLASGKTLWQVSDELASYSAPVLLQRDSGTLLLVLTRLNLLGLDEQTGQERFRVPFGSRGPTVNAALPVDCGAGVLLTASYGIGATLLTVSDSSVTVRWEDPLLSSQYTTPIVSRGIVYGIDGRQDGGPVSLVCFEPATRKVNWRQECPEYATLIAADNKLLVMASDGVLTIAELSPDAYRPLSRHRLSEGTTRALPAFANGTLFVRDERELLAYSLE